MSIELVKPSNYLVLCCPLLLLPSILSSISVFFNESFLHIRLPNYWSFSFSFPGGSEVKASACNVGDPGSIPGSGRSPGEGNSNPLQYSCLENPMDGGGWWATVHGVAKSRTRLSDFTFTFSFSIIPSNEYSGLISLWMDWFDILTVQETLKSLLQHYSSIASNLLHSAFIIVQISHP